MVHVTQESFGTCVDPFTGKTENIVKITMTNKQRMSASVLTYGATIFSIFVPDANGRLEDINLGYDDIPGYQTPTNPYIGGLIGRVCSRVGNGRYILNGEEVKVSRNFLGKHQLHGGVCGFDKVIWTIKKIRPDGVVLEFISPEGHEGYPGICSTTTTYTITEDNCFRFCIEATVTKPCPVNMTNHAYFNLAGHNAGKRAMCEHMVMIKATKYTEKDEDTVPTGRLGDTAGLPIDVSKMTNVGEGLKKLEPLGYDDNYVLEWKKNAVICQAKAYHPPSGRWMEISSNQPGMHFYTSHNMPDGEKGIPGLKGKNGANYVKHGSFCMETHWYPDAMNHPEFPSVILYPGQKYQHICIFKFGACRSK